MLEKLMRLYTMALAYDVRSPMPHLVGPPGCGKSSIVEQLADLLGVNLHVINVSRLSPLEIEGVQMPHGSDDEMVLKMLPATFWTSLKEEDILLMDEFLRGFPEVYNALLDIFTSRRVGAFQLPRVFIIGASNSIIAYDKAMEDRLLHLLVPDPRHDIHTRRHLAELLVSTLGLLPEMATSPEMEHLLSTEVLPTYDLLDSFKKKGAKHTTVLEGTSIRNLIGQAQLRYVTSEPLQELITINNRLALSEAKYQFVLILDPKTVTSSYKDAAKPLLQHPRLTDVQRINIRMNLQLIELQEAKDQGGST